jgi:hypothetical protein
MWSRPGPCSLLQDRGYVPSAANALTTHVLVAYSSNDRTSEQAQRQQHSAQQLLPVPSLSAHRASPFRQPPRRPGSLIAPRPRAPYPPPRSTPDDADTRSSHARPNDHHTRNNPPLSSLSQAPRSSRRMHGPTITIPVTITTRLYHTRNNPPAAAVAVCAKTPESNSYPAFAVRRRSSMFVAPLSARGSSTAGGVTRRDQTLHDVWHCATAGYGM